ncbi:hypothetical protein BU17DRAFT_38588 [Hysterangium stoloniferum]|nr:hypothetical protein BU17DRAFT_38588 [Hysterangium stoloniferum]
MLYDESTASSLKPWLVRSLQPICDADPEALADYVLALLKHDAAEPDLRKMFINQLEEFLEKESAKFVDTLFAALRTKSYLPYESAKADIQDVGIPIPIDALMSGPSDRGRKRSLEHDEHDHPLPKGPRLGNGSYSRYGPQNGRMLGRGAPSHRGGHTNGRGMGRGEGMSVNGHMPHQTGNMEGGHMYRPPGSGFTARPRRGICRDYHNNGFCARGSLCQYSHGEDAVIPPMPYVNGPGMVNNIPGGGAPFMPMFPSNNPFVGMSGAAYDPHESHMEMGHRHNRGPRHDGRGPDAIPVSSVELPVIQDLTPRDPVEEAGRGEAVVQPNGFTHNFGTPRRAQQQQPVNMLQPGVSTSYPPIAGHVGGGQMGSGAMESIQMGGNHMGGGAGGNGFRRSGRGSFTGEMHNFRNASRDDKTLVVEKIPDEKLSLEAVNEWFKRFGTVTNVAIDTSSSKALVSFSNHTEAHTAWKSEEAVFGNRFVRLFWHRPLDGQGGVGQRALAASAPLIKHIANPDASSSPLAEQPSPLPSQPGVPATPNKQPSRPDAATAAALAARQQLLERQISEQKVLMSRLSIATTPEEKQEIMTRIRDIQKGMTPSTTPITPQVPSSKSKNGKGGSKALSEKEMLDKELELHAVQTALGSGQGSTDSEATSTAALKEKLAQLKAEASRLGLPEADMDTVSPSTTYHPYRGRGFRARGLIRGRGGPPVRGSMKLDNRPRKLLIQGVLNEEAVQAVRNHYQNMGNLELFWKEDNEQVVAQFWSRSAAELALASGSDIPSVGKLRITWHSGPAPSSTPIPAPSSLSQSESSDVKMKVDPAVSIEAKTETLRTDHDDGGWGQAFDDDEDNGRRRRSRSRSRSFS